MTILDRLSKVSSGARRWDASVRNRASEPCYGVEVDCVDRFECKDSNATAPQLCCSVEGFLMLLSFAVQ